MRNKQIEDNQSLADLLDDLTPEELTNMVNYFWVNRLLVTRSAIKGFRKSIKKDIDK